MHRYDTFRTNVAILRRTCQEWWVKVSFLVLVIAGLGTVAGFRVNVTRSLPLGLYHVGDASAVERGSAVIVCLPEAWARFALRRGILGPGHCEGGSYGLGKMVLAVGGDVVEFRQEGLRVNGRSIPNSRTLERDRHGRSMPHHPWGSYKLRPGEVWLFSPYHRGAFDSRYFGPISSRRIRSVIRPVWTDSQTPWASAIPVLHLLLLSRQAPVISCAGPLWPGPREYDRSASHLRSQLLGKRASSSRNTPALRHRWRLPTT